MGFPRQDYWGGLSYPSLGDLPNPGMEPMFSAFEGGYIFLPLSHQKSPVLNVVVYKHAAAACACPCLTLCNPIDGSPPGSPIPGILQTRTLKWIAISFSNAWKWKVKVRSLSHVQLFATPWTGAYQAPPSMGFSRQEYWSGVPLPSSREFMALGIIPRNKCFTEKKNHTLHHHTDKMSQLTPRLSHVTLYDKVYWI